MEYLQQDAAIGFHLRELYARSRSRQFTAAQQHLVDQWSLTLGHSHNQHVDWKQLVSSHGVWTDFFDAEFVLSRLLHHRVRRATKRIDNIPVPSLPSSKHIQEDVRAKCIGKWNNKTNNRMVAGGLTGLADALSNKEILIGEPIKTTLTAKTKKGIEVVSKREYFGRMIPLKHALVKLVVQAFNNDLLLIPDNKILKLEYGLWPDGTTALAHPLLGLLAFLIWQKEYSVSSMLKWRDCMHQTPVVLCVTPETLKATEWMFEEIRPQILEVEKMELRWRGVVFSFRFRIFSADNSMMQKLFGNSVGGNARCWLCSADFQEGFTSLYDWEYLCSCHRKDITSLLSFWKADNPNPILGVARIPPLFGTSKEDVAKIDVKQPQWAFLEHLEGCIDFLHLCKGFLPVRICVPYSLSLSLSLSLYLSFSLSLLSSTP